MAKHKWHDEIVAWASGSEIESNGGCGWFSDASPDWNDDDYEFRIKPPQHCCCDKQTCSALKEPQYLYVYDTEEGIKLGAEGNAIPVKNLNGRYKLLGAIKIEVDD